MSEMRLFRTEPYININTPAYQMRVKNESNSLYSLSLTYSFGASIEGKDERQSAKDLRSRRSRPVTPALGSPPLKQSPQQPSSWRLLGACCIPRLQAGRYFLRPKLAPLLCLPLRSKYLLHRLHGPNVYPISSRRIRIVSKTYTFGGENVYVSSVKRIRLGHETYTFFPHKVYVLPPQPPPAPHERPAAPPSAPTALSTILGNLDAS